VKELALVFLRLGTIAFGGPAAHIAMMEQEFVRRRAWLTREQFLDLVGAAGLIPGPSSTEVAIYVGYRRAGWRGLLIAGLCFILPAATMVTVIALGLFSASAAFPALAACSTASRLSSSLSFFRLSLPSGEPPSRQSGCSRSEWRPRRGTRLACRQSLRSWLPEPSLLQLAPG